VALIVVAVVVVAVVVVVQKMLSKSVALAYIKISQNLLIFPHHKKSVVYGNVSNGRLLPHDTMHKCGY